MGRYNSHDSRRYYEWLDYAEADILAAQLLYKNEDTYLCAAFHCQQAMEKTLKSYYLFDTGFAPDGHNIIFLCKKLSRTSPEFAEWLDECINTNNYYIATRYPPDIPLDISEEKLKYLISSARRLFDFTYKQIEKDINGGIDESTGNTAKNKKWGT